MIKIDWENDFLFFAKINWKLVTFEKKNHLRKYIKINFVSYYTYITPHYTS